jgi:putative phosphoesterase
VKIGLISDTHNFFDPRLPEIFDGVDHILHAGDVGDRLILGELEAIAPVTAVLGNNDVDLPIRETAITLLGGKKFFVHHIITPGLGTQPVQARIRAELPDVVVFGHTHKAFAEEIDHMLFLNPGYAGRQRFKLERSVAVAEIVDGRFSYRFVTL